MNSIFIKLYVTWPKLEILIFEVIFVDFRLMKNIIFNNTKRFVGRNTSNHDCQIFWSKSNCETKYHWFLLLEITVAKIMNNLNVCSADSYLYPRSRFKYINVRKYQRGNPKMSIQKTWQQDEAKQSKNIAQYVLDTTM
jgi:hypothetical protein